MNSSTTQNTIEPESAYLEVQDFLRKLAWKFVARYNVPFEEAMREANWGFVQAVQKYDPNRGAKFITFVGFTANNRLMDWIMYRAKQPEMVNIEEAVPFLFLEETELFRTSDCVSEIPAHAPAQRSESLDMIEDLSTDAREIISLLIESPGELLGSAPATARQLLHKVKRYLVEQKGRNKKRIDEATLEIQTRLREGWAN